MTLHPDQGLHYHPTLLDPSRSYKKRVEYLNGAPALSVWDAPLQERYPRTTATTLGEKNREKNTDAGTTKR